MFGMPGAAAVVDLDPRPAELLDAAVGEHPRRVVERAVAVGRFLDDDDEGEVVEAQRRVQPPEARRAARRAARPGGAASPTGRMPHERSREPSQASGSTAISVPSTVKRAAPAAELGEPGRVEGDLVAGEQFVRLLQHRPGTSRPTSGRSRCRPAAASQTSRMRLQRLDHLDPVRARQQRPSDRSSRASEKRTANCWSPLRTSAYASITPRFGYTPEPGDEEDVTGAVVRVEVAPVVEVAVAASRPAPSTAGSGGSGTRRGGGSAGHLPDQS